MPCRILIIRIRLTPGFPDSLADDVLLLLKNIQLLILVDPVGIEPTTSTMPLWRAPSCAMGPNCFVNNPPVDLAGVEPATSSVRLMRAPNCATGPNYLGRS